MTGTDPTAEPTDPKSLPTSLPTTADATAADASAAAAARTCGQPACTLDSGSASSPPRAGGLRIATRGSALALAQANWFAEELRAAWPGLTVELVVVVTDGDRRRDVPASALGGKGSFTAAVQEAVLDGRADVAVHSAKDLPAVQAAGLVLAAVPRREDPVDVLVAPGLPAVRGLADLPDGARVGTGSPRRVALLGHLCPDVKPMPLRGNVDTRLRKARSGEVDAVILAAAGLRRLGLLDEAGAIPLDPDTFVPAPGQGCLAVEARPEDTRTLGLLSATSHRPSRIALRGERAFLARLGGSCTLPAGALLTLGLDPAGPAGGLHAAGGRVEGRIEMHGFLAAADGGAMVRDRIAGPADDPESLGAVLAERLLAAADPAVRALVEDDRR